MKMMKYPAFLLTVIWLGCRLVAANLCEDASQWVLEGKSRDYSRLENSAAQGRNSLRLLYDFKIAEGRDLSLIIKLKKPLTLEKDSRLSLWIYDTASAHRFYFMCRDAKGKTVLFSYTEKDFRSLRHNGWAEYGFTPGADRCDVWGGNSAETKELAYPLQLVSFWLDPVNRTRREGEIFLAGLTLDGKEITTETAAPPVARPVASRQKPKLTVKGKFHGTLSWGGERQELKFHFSPGGEEFGNCEESVEFLDYGGNLLATRTRPVNATADLEHSVPLPDEVNGYFQIRYRLLRNGEIMFESRATGGHFVPVPQPALKEARLGMGFWNSDWDQACSTLRNMGIRWVRADAGWSWIEPKQGEFRWEDTDRLLRAAEKNGMSMLITTQYIPKWAAMQPYHQYGGNPEPREWERFYRQLIERHGKRIAVYEVWNEPDTPYHWAGGPAAYAEHMRRTAQIIRECAPEALIAHAGLTGDEKLWRPFAEELLKFDIGKHFDLYTFHYGNGKSASLHRELLNKAGLGGKRIWNTESGWGTANERILQIVRDFSQGVEVSFYFEFQSKVAQFAATSMMTPEFYPQSVMPMFLTLSRLLDGAWNVRSQPFSSGEMYRISPDTVIFQGGNGVSFRTDRKQLRYTDAYGKATELSPVQGIVGVPSRDVGYLTLPEKFEVLPGMIGFADDTTLIAGAPNRIRLTLRHPGNEELRATLTLSGSPRWNTATAQREVVLRPNQTQTVELELQPDLLSAETPFHCDAELKVAGKTVALQSFAGIVGTPVRTTVQPIFQQNRPGLRVHLENLLDTPQDVRVSLRLPASWNSDIQRDVKLAAGEKSEFSVLLSGTPELRKDQAYFVTAITTALGSSARVEYQLSWIGIPAIAADTLWEKIPFEAEVRERKYFVPNHEILETWLGPQDLSVRFFWGWSPEKIRMRWVVTDDKHVNDSDPAFTWDRDSIQIWYDGCLYDLALSKNKSVIYAHGENTIEKRMKLAVSRIGDKTVYQLEIQPEAGSSFRADMNFPFSFCVNDNDGEPTRKGWMYHFAKTGIPGERQKSPRVTLMAR